MVAMVGFIALALLLLLLLLDQNVIAYIRTSQPRRQINQRTAVTFPLHLAAVPPRDSSGANYSQDSLMLKASNGDASYRVVLPSGMDPSLTPAEKKVAERLQASLAEDPKKTDLDLLKEELKRMLDSMQ